MHFTCVGVKEKCALPINKIEQTGARPIEEGLRPDEISNNIKNNYEKMIYLHLIN